jgi:hypothetical protein
MNVGMSVPQYCPVQLSDMPLRMISKPLIHSHGHCQNHALVILPHFLTTTHSELDLEATVPYFNQSNFSEFRRRCLPSLPKLGGGGEPSVFLRSQGQLLL